MCGIVGYIGNKRALPFLIDGLRKLEYRGYDSAGLTVLNGNELSRTFKTLGYVSALEKNIERYRIEGNVGIAHTRWATHGIPAEKNAHPHFDCKKNIFLVHNGIVENYLPLKTKLIEAGHIFLSETDSEVIAHMVEEVYAGNLEDAVIDTLNKVRGSYGLVVCSTNEPDKIVVAKNSSPIVIGAGENEFIVASDTIAVPQNIKQIFYIKDNELAVIRKNKIEFKNLKNKYIERRHTVLIRNSSEAALNGFPHFMLKEICEQPESIGKSIGNYFNGIRIDFGISEEVKAKIRSARRLIIVACGTAYFAGVVGKYMIEENTGISVEVIYASEFRYKELFDSEGVVVLCISQSGETADVLGAVRMARRSGALTLGVINAENSTIAREVDAVIYNNIGQEIGVASTKAFTSQLAILVLLTIFLGSPKNIPSKFKKSLFKEIGILPELIKKVIAQKNVIYGLSKKYYVSNNMLFIGRGYNFPIALEGALKLKEVSYIHAEGYAAGELKHGSIALIEESVPTLAIALSDRLYEKTISNLEEIKSRKGPLIVVATEGNEDIKKLTTDVIYIPKVSETLSPILSVIPLQFFAYYCSIMRGINPDRPRNLAKSVTVE